MGKKKSSSAKRRAAKSKKQVARSASHVRSNSMSSSASEGSDVSYSSSVPNDEALHSTSVNSSFAHKYDDASSEGLQGHEAEHDATDDRAVPEKPPAFNDLGELDYDTLEKWEDYYNIREPVDWVKQTLPEVLDDLDMVGQTEPYLARQALSTVLYDLYVRYKSPRRSTDEDEVDQMDAETMAATEIRRLMRDLIFPVTVEGSSSLYTDHVFELMNKNLKHTYAYYAYSNKVALGQRAELSSLLTAARCQLTKAQLEGAISALDQSWPTTTD